MSATVLVYSVSGAVMLAAEAEESRVRKALGGDRRLGSRTMSPTALLAVLTTPLVPPLGVLMAATPLAA